MTKNKSTKRALISSMLVLVLCVTAFFGSTYAWFTDSVTSSGNKIQAGKLDVQLLMNTGNGYEDISTSTDPIFGKADSTAATNVNADTLWEPGKTQVAYLAIKNGGNLALKYDVTLVTKNETKNMHEVMKYAITPDAQYTSVTSWDAANAKSVTVGTEKVANFTELAVGATHYFALSIHMDEKADNKYQEGAIEFDINVFATQKDAESDSFGPDYDEPAPEDVWNGSIPAEMPDTLVVDAATQTIHVKDPAAFAYLSTLSAKWADLYTDGNGTEYNNYANGSGEKYYYSGQWTVSLEADINLMNYPIDPVVIKFGASTGASAFKGNNHVISNINTTTGLFADKNWANYADLTLENVKATNGALTGSANTNISNVTVKNATISGKNYVGGLVGYLYGDITGCQVIDSSVTASGEDAGGLTGYTCQESGTYTVSNNKVQNVSVYAKVRAAGLIATANTTGEVCDNTLDNVTVVAAEVDTDGHKADTLISWNLVGNVHDNTVNNCKVGREVYGLTLIPDGDNSKIIVNDKEGFLNLTKLFADWTELFTDGNGTDYSNYANGAGADYYYSSRWTVSLEADIDLNNATISPVVIKHPVSTGNPTFDGNGKTIKNAKIVTDPATENEAGLFNASSIAFKNLKLDNIHVTGSNVGNSTAGVLAGSCNFPVDNITITNSSVTGGKYTGGVIGYGYTDITGCTLTNVTVKGGYKLGGLIGYICASGTNTSDVTGNTLTDCKVDGIGDGQYAGGKSEYIIGQVVGNYNCNGTCNDNTVTNMTSSASDAIGAIEAGKDVTQ